MLDPTTVFTFSYTSTLEICTWFAMGHAPAPIPESYFQEAVPHHMSFCHGIPYDFIKKEIIHRNIPYQAVETFWCNWPVLQLACHLQTGWVFILCFLLSHSNQLGSTEPRLSWEKIRCLMFCLRNKRIIFLSFNMCHAYAHECSFLTSPQAVKIY